MKSTRIASRESTDIPPSSLLPSFSPFSSLLSFFLFSFLLLFSPLLLYFISSRSPPFLPPPPHFYLLSCCPLPPLPSLLLPALLPFASPPVLAPRSAFAVPPLTRCPCLPALLSGSSSSAACTSPCASGAPWRLAPRLSPRGPRASPVGAVPHLSCASPFPLVLVSPLSIPPAPSSLCGSLSNPPPLESELV